MGALLASLGVAAALGGLPGAARAEEQPAILKAYGLDWIERVRDDAWPQPKTQRPVICLLDTGVDITPDTPADDPNGPIVARLALDGGTGTSQGTEWQHQHGTQMAAIMAAPRNGYGTVGVFPQARIVSIRVTEGADTFITPEAIAQGVRVCLRFGLEHALRVAVINISESNYSQRSADVARWQSAARFAEDSTATVIAAVGNDAESTTVAPLALTDVVGVSAGAEDGTACGFVAAIPQPGALRGPGCALSRSWPAGSSAASAAVSALAGALVTRDPTLTSAGARERIWAAAPQAGGSDRVLKAGVLAGGFPLVPDMVTSHINLPAQNISKADAGPALRLWRPRVSVKWRPRRLTVRRVDARRGGRIAVSVGPGSTARIVHGRPGSRKLTLNLRRKPGRISVWIESTGAVSWRSLAVRSAVR